MGIHHFLSFFAGFHVPACRFGEWIYYKIRLSAIFIRVEFLGRPLGFRINGWLGNTPEILYWVYTFPERISGMGKIPHELHWGGKFFAIHCAPNQKVKLCLCGINLVKPCFLRSLTCV